MSRARRERDGLAVVLKAAARSDSPASLRLRHEYELLARLGVTGISRALALDEDEAGGPMLVLADAGPRNLEQWLHRQALVPRTFLDLAVQLADVLARLHERGILHRELTPSNVVVDDGGVVTLVDFDAASAPEAPAPAGDATMALDLETSLPYLAPEQTGRTGRPVDARADLYALGAVFYEMLTGAPPFAAAGPVAIVHGHLARPVVPPSKVNPTVPVVLSDLVLRLMEKMPERRYQSAQALLADLNEAAARLDETGAIAPFELGRVDLDRQLPMPEGLFGRQPEEAVLASAWQRARAGAAQILVVSGEAGIGKSALVQELCHQVAAQGGWSLVGKADQARRHTPHAALRDAFRDVAAALDGPRTRRLTAALGANARSVFDLVPGLERALGETPPLRPADPVQKDNRRLLAVQALLWALATADEPVLLFVDDLQWADAATIEALASLVVGRALPDHTLLVLACRPEETAAVPEAQALVDAIAGSGHRVLAVPPLSGTAVQALLAETLRVDPPATGALAQILVGKTAGNPLFLRRLLRFLQQSGLLSRDPADRTWSWDAARIAAVPVTDNVVELLTMAVQELPEPIQQLLGVAACIGRRVPLALLAAVQSQPADDIAGALAPAILEGLIRPLGDGPSLTFAHDRVLQAVYDLLPEGRREELHLRVGRKLLEGSAEDGPDEELFALVDQFDRAGDRLTGPERIRLAELCLRAGDRARTASAWAPALDYYRRGIGRLGPERWGTHRALTAALHRKALAGAYLTGDLTLARRLFEAAIAHLDAPADQAAFDTIRVWAGIASGAADEAVRAGREGLARFGEVLPATPAHAAEAGAREMALVERTLAGRSPGEIVHAPAMDGPAELAQMDLLSALNGAVFIIAPELRPFVVARMVNLSLRHGHAPESPLAFVAYAILLLQQPDGYARSGGWSRLGLALAERRGDPAWRCRVLAAHAALVQPWHEPLRDCLPLLRQARELCQQVGDMLHGVFAQIAGVAILFCQGVELPRVLAEIESGLAAALTTSNAASAAELRSFRRAAHRLRGVEPGEAPPEPDPERPVNTFTAELNRLRSAYLLGDLGEALASAARAAPYAGRAWAASSGVEYTFFAALAAAAAASGTPEGERGVSLSEIAGHLRQLEVWSGACPQNFRAKHLMVAGEMARLQGRPLDAAASYDEAIDAATRESLLSDSALASELAGRCFHQLGRTRLAAPYLAAAIEGYLLWGANAKARALEAEFPDLDRVRRPLALGQVGTGADGALDRLSLIDAAETISSEIVLPRLLEKLLDVCLHAAGAERAVLLVEEDGQAFLRAARSTAEPASLQRTPLERAAGLPRALIEGVRRTGEPLVLTDASRHEAFRGDPDIAARGVRSVLALPVQRQARLVAVLYLENNLATSVFTAGRVRVLQVLSSQIAISLENSLLFESLTAEIEERRRAEASVALLAESGVALAASLDYRDTLERVAHLGVPFLADWCVVDLLEQGQLQRVAEAHRDPAKLPLLRELPARLEGWAPPRYALEAMAAAAPVLHADLEDAAASTYPPDPEALRWSLELGARSAMTVALRARGSAIGAMTFVSGEVGRRYGPRDVALAAELGRRASGAIENARLYREAYEAIQARDEFLSVASHELRTPLTSLLMNLKAMVGEEPGLDVRPADPTLTARLAAASDRQARRLVRLVDDLLDTSLIHRRALELRPERLDLGKLVRDVVARFQPELRRAGCEAHLHAPEGVVGVWDPHRLEQVVLNLLSNAAKFGARRPIEIRVDHLAGSTRLVVRDRGIGIEPGRQARIFERFERAVPASHYGGMGLGLYISRHIVESHGGTIALQSEPGKGATFTVTLPS